MARRGYRKGGRRRGRRWGGFWQKRSAPQKRHSVINWVAAILAIMGITVPVAQEGYLRWKQTGNFWDGLNGAGDMLSVMFLGRTMAGAPSTSTYKYAGWYVLGGSLAIVIVNKLVSNFAGHVRIWKNWVVN